jgi:hypothetical protein
LKLLLLAKPLRLMLLLRPHDEGELFGGPHASRLSAASAAAATREKPFIRTYLLAGRRVERGSPARY